MGDVEPKRSQQRTRYRLEPMNGMETKKIARWLKGLLQVIISLAVLAGLVWGLYTVLARLVAHLMTLNPNVAASIIAASATVLMATISVLLSKQLEIRTLVFKEHRDKKIPIYESLIEFFYNAMFQTKKGTPVSESEMIDFLQGFVGKITVWGSDDVLKAVIAFKSQTPDVIAQDPAKSLFVLENMLFVIRRDLGHKNKNMKQGDLLSLFVTDIDKHLPQQAGRGQRVNPV